MELIYFPLSKKIDLENQDIQIKFNKINIIPKLNIKQLGILIDYKLRFEEYIKNQITKATRVFYQIKKLSNIERGLTFQAMR